ncbi:MAG: hypothetical protein HUU10_00920 [Bacteroidetes bacterium]|nr:hypothetical protein [Bacteroidota bacterium]
MVISHTITGETRLRLTDRWKPAQNPGKPHLPGFDIRWHFIILLNDEPAGHFYVGYRQEGKVIQARLVIAGEKTGWSGETIPFIIGSVSDLLLADGKAAGLTILQQPVTNYHPEFPGLRESPSDNGPAWFLPIDQKRSARHWDDRPD